jgi:hypothetical protein
MSLFALKIVDYLFFVYDKAILVRDIIEKKNSIF